MLTIFGILGVLSLLSLGLNVWQWLAADRFPLHRPVPEVAELATVTLLKPLKGSDAHTQACLRSWLSQDYPVPLQVLFGVTRDEDPVCEIIPGLMKEFPQHHVRLVVCPDSKEANPKISTVMQLEPLIEGEVVIVSDADVKIPQNYL